jgi:hypothetical protein
MAADQNGKGGIDNMASSTTATNFGTALSSAISGGYVAQLNGGTYTVTQPIVIDINSTITGPIGINGGGATINSEITNGQPVIEIVVGPGVDLRYLDLSNFNIVGNGQEGDGIQIIANGNNQWVYNWNINNVNVSHVGGYGLDMQGSIFEGLVSNSYMNDNGLGGAYIANSSGGGVASALHWFGGGFENNNGAGLTLGDGARDISVDGVTASGNNGPGINAPSGITSVTDSTFENNQGSGISYQVYGNFNDDSFSSSGAQTAGISGYTLGETSLVGDTSTTELANLTGSGTVLETGNTGAIVTAAGVTTGGVGSGDQVSVSVSTHGVALPTLAAITEATVADPASSAGTSGLDAVLHAAFASDSVVQATSETSYTVSAPIVINITSSAQAVGINLGGASITSDITNGAPVIEIVIAAGVTVGSLNLSNFAIFGNGAEGDGIKIVSNGTTQLNIANVDVEHTGGIGLDVIGNVQGSVTDSWMNGNALGGAQFANGPAGGTASDLQWVGGGFRLNGVAGLILNNGAHDMSVSGAYFVENNGPGIDAPSGITSVLGSGFENNTGGGAVVQGSANFTDDTFSTYGPQVTAVGGYLNGGEVTMTGIDAEYYGTGANPMVLANLQGQGTLAVFGGGSVVTGPGITVTGGDPTLNPPNLTTAWGGTSSGSTGGTTGSSTTAPVSGTAGDPPAAEPAPAFTGGSITNGEVTLTGTTGQAGDQVTIYDGSTWLGATTTSSTGSFSFTAAANASVVNDYGLYATDPSGNIWHGSALVIDPPSSGAGSTTSSAPPSTPSTPSAPSSSAEPVPVFTGGSITNGEVTLTGTTGHAGDQVTIYDGNSWLGATTTTSTGSFSFTAPANASVVNSYGAYATDPSGNIYDGATPLVISPADPVPVFTGGSITNGEVTLTGTTGQAGDQVTIYDGSTWLGTATTSSTGAFTFTAPANANVVNDYGAYTTDPSGNIWKGTTPLVIGAAEPTPVFTGGSITNGEVTLTGTTGQAGDQVTIYDGSTWLGATTTNSTGSFTFTAAANASVVNDYGIYATDPSGNIWHGSPLTIDPPGTVTLVSAAPASDAAAASSTESATAAAAPVPSFTSEVVSDGHVNLTGTTGAANDQVSIYDGNTWLGFATTGANGSFTFSAAAASNEVHIYGANATDPDGDAGHGSNNVIVGGSAAATLTASAGDDIVNANGANDTIVAGPNDQMTAGGGQATFGFQTAAASTPSAPATITDFQHGVDKIDFTGIAGIAASNGVPLFQGNITGTGNLTLNPHSIAYVEVGGNTDVLVNSTGAAETVTTSNLHAAQMEIVLQGVHLGLSATDFHHA